MKTIETRDRYAAFYPITTRWSDNDLYGHVNNVNRATNIPVPIPERVRTALAEVARQPAVAPR